MWSLTCVPVTVYNTLGKFKTVLCCVQARHCWVFCRILIALILDHGKGSLKELCQYLPSKLRYWRLMCTVRSGQWDAEELVSQMGRDVLNWLPVAADGAVHLNADKTCKDKRRHQHPVGLVTRESLNLPYHFGSEMAQVLYQYVYQ